MIAFEVIERDGVNGVRRCATVDVKDTDAVVAVVNDKLTEIQTERDLPMHLLVRQPLARLANQLKARPPGPRPLSVSAPFRQA